MKTTVLFTALMLLGLTSAHATPTNVAPQGEDFFDTARYRYAEPIMFVELGIEFLIFPDGSFDFNTHPGNSIGQYGPAQEDMYYYRSTDTKRRSVNTTQGAPGTMSRYAYDMPNAGGILIQHDFDGKVRRIGHVFINYDRAGKVKRIGSVYMSYNRGGLLTQVGGLRLTYNHWGEIVNSHGAVQAYNTQHYYGHGQNPGHAYGNSDWNSNSYYYKQAHQGETAKKSKS